MFRACHYLFIALFCVSLSHVAWATKVGSREYKLLLEASAFDGSNPEAAVQNFWTDLETVIENSIDRSTSGSFSLAKNRTIKFYDTPSTCVLKNNSLVFRERIEDGDREVTLKYRSPDRYIAGHQDMSGTESDAETKFEEDISALFQTKYSHSTTQGIGSSKNINKMDDPIGLYPDLDKYNFDEDEALAQVGNVTISEKVYKGPSVDLGNKDAEFSVTLWYTSANSITPVVAEVSYKYKDADEDYSENVVTRAKLLFDAMQCMSWMATNSVTKTAFVYAYDANFCQ